MNPLRSWLIGALLVLMALPAVAEENDGRDAFRGLVDVGYRKTDMDGNENKFREDVNLSDGALRLFELRTEYEPAGATWFDDAILEASGVGGEPYTSARFGLRKLGRYDFGLRYRSSEFFYRDAGYFLRDGGDLHAWDARRSFFDLDLKVHVSERVRLRLGVDHNTREGDSTSSRDVQQEVFLLQRPVDQETSSYLAGVDVGIGWGDLTVEQGFTSSENRWKLATSASDGEEPGGSFLDDYLQRRTENTDAPISHVAFRGQPSERLRFSAGYSRTDAELDFDADGKWGGQDFTGQDFRTTVTNQGDVDRKLEVWDADLTVGLHDSLDLKIDYSRRSYDQDGRIDYVENQVGGANAGLVVVRGDLHNDLELDTYGATLEWRPARAVAFNVGAGQQQRAKNFQLSGPEIETERTVYRAGARWRPNRIWNVRLGLEMGDDNDPLTPISVTSTDRLRLAVDVRPIDRLAFSVRFSDDSKENDLSTPLGLPTDDTPPASEISLAEFDVTTWAFEVTWDGPRLDLNAGYTNSAIVSTADIVFVTGSTFVPVFDVFTTRARTDYVADSDIVYGSVRYAFSKAWSAGAHGFLTRNTGSFPLESTIYGVDVRYEHGSGAFVRAAFDTYDYDEDNPFAGDPAARTPDVNDYDADLWTVAVGYRF